MIIFLYGPDTFRSRRKLAQIKEKFIADIDKSSLNIEQLDGAMLTTSDFERAILTPPFLARKRLVIVEQLISSKHDAVKKEIAELLNRHDLEGVIVVFWEADTARRPAKKSAKSAAKKPAPSSLLKHLLKEKYAQEFSLLDSAGTLRFALDETEKRGIKIEPSALRLLIDMVGNDLWRLDTELNKLAAFRSGQSITTDDVANLVQTPLEQDIFQLTDAIGRRQKAKAIQLISEQLKGGTAPTELLAKVTWQFKNLLLTKEFTERNGAGYAPDRLAFQLGLHPFVVKKALGQISQFSLVSLKQSYARLIDIDRTIKTSRIDPEVLFDLLVVKS